MPTTLQTNARNAAADAIAALLSGGTIQLLTSADAVVATLDLPVPAFDPAASGVATAEAIAAVTVSAAGTVAKWQGRTSANAPVIDGDVTTAGGGGSMILTSLTFAEGEQVQITALTLTMPAA